MWDALKVLLVFCAAGPLVGLVIFATGFALSEVVGGRSGGFWVGAFFLVYGLVFAHFAGIVPAAIAALVAIVLRYAVSGVPRWIGPASGAASFVLGWMGAFLPTLNREGGPDGFALFFIPLMALVHVGAASASWLLVRRRLRD